MSMSNLSQIEVEINSMVSIVEDSMFQQSNTISEAMVQLLIAETIQQHNEGKVSLSDETLFQLVSVLNDGNERAIMTNPSGCGLAYIGNDCYQCNVISGTIE